MFKSTNVFINNIIRYYKKFVAFESKGALIAFRLMMGIFVILIALFYFSKANFIYSVPIDKPYFTGEWDEPFAINAGINALKYNLNPVFYKYGGTSVYPEALTFYVYEKITGRKPVYYMYDKAMGEANWPMTRKIYPVKPIYIAKVLAYILFLLGSFVFTGLFSILLLPVPFWPKIIAAHGWIGASGVINYYSFQMLPTSQIALLAGITSIFFFKTLLEKEQKEKFKWLLLCSVASSMTAAAQLNTAFIMLLPLSLSIKLYAEGYLRSAKKIFLFAVCLILPYLVVNPATLLSSPDYRKWLFHMFQNAKTVGGSWQGRINTIMDFIKDINILSSLPGLALIILFVLTVILFVKLDVFSFCGFSIFFFYSFYKTANMKEALYSRHFSFLILPAVFWFIFPLIYFYQRSSRNLKVLISAVLLTATLIVYPYASVNTGIKALFKDTFVKEWERESRDNFADFVLRNKAFVYFYGYHLFSLPDNLRNNMLEFSKTEEIPRKLKSNEYIGLILYAASNRDEYNIMIKKLLRGHKVVKYFGNPKGAYDLNDGEPLANPTIVLLK